MLRLSTLALGTLTAATIITACTVLAPMPTKPIVPTAVPPKVVVQVVPVPAITPTLPQKEVTPPSTPKVPTSPYIGKPIEDVIGAIGQPIGSADMGNGEQAFQFYAKPKKPKCVASYITTRENDTKPWIVTSYIEPDAKTCL